MPRVVRNPVSIAGAWLATVGAFAFLSYYVVDELGLLTSPYSGLFGFVVAPAVFLAGLLLIPVGMWREARRRHRGGEPWTWPTIRLGSSSTRRVLAAIGLLTVANLMIVAVAGLGAVHYMETDEFCGQVCHTPMTPQFTAHETAPHAEVGCVQCHVSPGAAGTVRAKLNGTRQLASLLMGTYERPIPSPARGLPVAADTCAQCHTPGFPDRDMLITRTSYASNEASSESTTTLQMMMSRIHWHARPDVNIEFVATDETRDTIPWLRLTNTDGTSVEFMSDGTTSRPEGTLRRMDCLDCHSRPAHQFRPSADAAVDAELARGEVSRALPWVRREMIAALTAEYADRDAAVAGIGRALPAFYETQPTVSPAEVAQAVSATQELYRRNVFPDMNVTWGTYLSQLGHTQRPGCMRCHDDGHAASDGRPAIPMDCVLCHEFR